MRSEVRGAGRARAVLLAALLLAAGALTATAQSPFGGAPAPPVPPAFGRATFDSLAALIPNGTVETELLTPVYTQRVMELTKKLVAAQRANPGWFQAYMRQPQPRPWHPNLGLTRLEYEEYLREGRRVTMSVRGRERLTFQRVGQARRWIVHGRFVLKALDGIILDLDGRRSGSSLGALPFYGIMRPTSSDASLDWSWYGVWKAFPAAGSRGPASTASLHMGPVDGGRNVALYWVARRPDPRSMMQDEFVLLRYPTPR